MSNGYDNTNEGVLFSASDKKMKSTDRDYSGNAEVVCPHCRVCSDHWLSAWVNESQRGQKYLKLKFNAKDQPSEAPTSGDRKKNPDGTTKPPSSCVDFDDMPF